MKKSVVLLTLFVLAVFLITGCGKKEAAKEVSALDKVKQAGVLKIGTSPDYPPFESIDDHGNVIGFDIDLAKEVAKELGVKAEFVRMGFDTIITAVKNSQVDVGFSSFSVNEERKLSIDFSKAYMSSSQVILVKKDSTIASKEDLKGAVISCLRGSTGAEAAKGIEGADVKEVDDNNIATMMLANGSSQAVVLDVAIANELASKHDFKVIETPLQHEETAAVIKKGNEALRAAIDKAIEKIMADGRHQTIKDTWKVK